MEQSSLCCIHHPKTQSVNSISCHNVIRKSITTYMSYCGRPGQAILSLGIHILLQWSLWILQGSIKLPRVGTQKVSVRNHPCSGIRPKSPIPIDLKVMPAPRISHWSAKGPSWITIDLSYWNQPSYTPICPKSFGLWHMQIKDHHSHIIQPIWSKVSTSQSQNCC